MGGIPNSYFDFLAGAELLENYIRRWHEHSHELSAEKCDWESGTV